MNGEQACTMQKLFQADSLDWGLVTWPGDLYLSFAEWQLFIELYWEFYPDVGNLYRIPMMIREED